MPFLKAYHKIMHQWSLLLKASLILVLLLKLRLSFLYMNLEPTNFVNNHSLPLSITLKGMYSLTQMILALTIILMVDIVATMEAMIGVMGGAVEDAFQTSNAKSAWKMVTLPTFAFTGLIQIIILMSLLCSMILQLYNLCRLTLLSPTTEFPIWKTPIRILISHQLLLVLCLPMSLLQVLPTLHGSLTQAHHFMSSVSLKTYISKVILGSGPNFHWKRSRFAY